MNRLKELREKNNLTLKKLSEELQEKNIKISADSLAKYERGERNPKIDKWQALADFFQVTVTYLKGVSNSKESYSKDYIYNQLLSGYNEDWQDHNQNSLRDEVDTYLKLNNIKKPKELTLDFIKGNFSFILLDNNIKRLLTTKDSYSKDDIKELISNAFIYELIPQTIKDFFKK